jgi:hypothetical protein
MDGRAILAQVERQRLPGHRFIKWWQREHDFINFELLSAFEERIRHDGEINLLEGFELLDTEQMWNELRQRFPDRVAREKRTKGEYLVWRRPGKDTRECHFSPENLMTVFDVETRGVVVD